MKIIVCGGRTYDDYATVSRTLDVLDAKERITVIAHGDAWGADMLADTWALSHVRTVHRYPADWRRHGRAAGPLRNQAMLGAETPDYVVAFPGGDGTADMVRRAREAGIKVIEVP